MESETYSADLMVTFRELLILGSWSIAAEAGALGVGPAQGDISWWSNSEEDVATRACFFDDTFVFGADGSFANVMGGCYLVRRMARSRRRRMWSSGFPIRWSCH